MAVADRSTAFASLQRQIIAWKAVASRHLQRSILRGHRLAAAPSRPRVYVARTAGSRGHCRFAGDDRAAFLQRDHSAAEDPDGDPRSHENRDADPELSDSPFRLPAVPG